MSESDLHVIFGTGPLGLAVMRELVQRGKRVRMINRSGKADTLPGVEVTAGDAYNQEFTRRMCQDAAVVYQCAQPAYYEWVKKFPALLQSIIEGVSRSETRLVVGDNLYMYGLVHGPIKEDLPYNPNSRKGKVRAEMDRAILEAHRCGNIRASIGRGSDFFGPHVLESTLGARAILPALHGKTASLVGKLDVAHTYTFIDDFGKALVILGEHEEALGQAWNVPNPLTMTQREVMTMFFDEIGKPPKMSGMNRVMMAFGGIFIREAHETVEMMYEFEHAFVVDHSKFANAFGNHATPMREAVRQTLAWYRQYFNL